MAAAYLKTHHNTLKTIDLTDTEAFKAEAMKHLGLIEEIIPQFRSFTLGEYPIPFRRCIILEDGALSVFPWKTENLGLLA